MYVYIYNTETHIMRQFYMNQHAYNLHCTMYIIHFTSYIVHSTVYSVLSIYIPYSVHCTVYTRLHIL